MGKTFRHGSEGGNHWSRKANRNKRSFDGFGKKKDKPKKNNGNKNGDRYEPDPKD